MIKARRSSRLVLATAWQLATSTAAARSTRSTPLLQSHPAAAEVVGNNPLARATAPAPARAPDDDLAAVREPAFKARPHQPQRRHERLSPLSPSPPTPTTAPSRSGFLSDLAPGLSDGPAVLAPVDPHMKAALRTRASQRQSQPEVVVLSPDLASASTSLRPSSPPPLGDKLPHAPALPLIEPTSSSVHHVKQSDASSHGAPDVQCLGKPTGPQSPPGPDQQAIDDWASSVRPQREPSLLATHSDNSSGGSDASPSHMTSASLDRLGSAPRMMKASKVPASQLGRLLHYGGLAAGLGFGAASEAIKRVSFGAAERDHASSLFMSEANVRRLVDKLSRMRGAALKLGQFMSIQDTKILPDQVEDILKRVQNSANYMPFEQTERVLASNLGSDWRTNFDDFDMIPFAAASIGQVHSARLSGRSSFAAQYPPSMRVAIKVQFPGVRASIKSDLANLKWLLMGSSVLPRGLYLENTIKVMERELDDECDYEREAYCGTRMRNLLSEYDMGTRFGAPRVVEELCGPMVLTTEFVNGVPLGEVASESQCVRNEVGESLLYLCLMELLHFKLMQTDPNWSNFLYDRDSAKIQLIDFGATREYSDDFVQKFRALLLAAVREDESECLNVSRELGYLNGEENEDMVKAHLASLLALGVPFRASSPTPFPFGDLGPAITSTIREQIPVMLKYRLQPPPTETYSLNRKLSGVFLLCERLSSHVNARGVLDDGLAKLSCGPSID